MNDKIKTAFDQIHADNSLKMNTKTFIYEKTNGYRKTTAAYPGRIRRMAAAMACVVLVFIAIGGYLAYTQPVAAISIDINPSIELKVNMFDKVIDVQGYNDDGVELLQQLDIKHMNYSDAINTVLNTQTVAESLEDNELLEVTITSSSEKTQEQMQQCIIDKTDVSPECIYCTDNHQEVIQAHSLGLSFGKYKAYLELQEINPDISVDDIKDMTMREIREMIQNSSSDPSDENVNADSNGNGNGNGNGAEHNSNQNTSGNGYGNGNGNAATEIEDTAKGNGTGSGNEKGQGQKKGSTN